MKNRNAKRIPWIADRSVMEMFDEYCKNFAGFNHMMLAMGDCFSSKIFHSTELYEVSDAIIVDETRMKSISETGIETTIHKIISKNLTDKFTDFDNSACTIPRKKRICDIRYRGNDIYSFKDLDDY